MRQKNNIPPSLQNIDLDAILRKRGIYTKLRMNKEAKENLKPIAKQMLKKKVKAAEPRRHAQFTNEVILAYWEKQIRIVDILEKKFELKVEQFINKVVDGFLEKIDHELPTKAVKKGYFDENEEELLVQAQLDFTPLLLQQAVLSGQEANRLIGTDDVYIPQQMRETIGTNVNRFTRSMLDTDREKLINTLNDGLKEGWSVPEIRKRIQDDFDEYSKMQSERITRTEVLRVSNQAALDAYEQSGVVEGKQWLTAGAVDECAQYEGQIETLNGKFYGDTDQFKDGDPPLHPNCRCVVLPVLVSEKAYTPPVNQELYKKIEALEAQIDKRTKAYKELQKIKADDTVYIKSLEKYLGIDDE